MQSNKFSNYLLDLGNIVRDRAIAVSLKFKENGSDYNVGELMAWHEIVSTMQSQAELFGIPLADIGLENITPETDLL